MLSPFVFLAAPLLAYLVTPSAAACSFEKLASLSSDSLHSCGDVPAAAVGDGPVTGYFEHGTGNAVFLGVPFGDTTAGKNRYVHSHSNSSLHIWDLIPLLWSESRWRAPQPVTQRKDVFKATAFGHSCPQASLSTGLAPQGEDCLNLNVWAPPSGKNYNARSFLLFQLPPQFVLHDFLGHAVLLRRREYHPRLMFRP